MCTSVKYVLFLVMLLVHGSIAAQIKSYTVTMAPFSSLTHDEFSPVYYKGGVVFCSNLKNNSLITYENQQNELFNIYYAPDSIKKDKIQLLAAELTTNYNDGPVTFHEEENMIYYSRNHHIQQPIRDVTDTTNNLGIYSAQLIDGQWKNIRSFNHNDPLYSFVTPALTHDGQRLYFASDMPGGYGGFDLYYCERNGDQWNEPVNLGDTINTEGNESFPFACQSGKLFFASDGHEGFGGKDIYYTRKVEGKWLAPIHLHADINSPYDDFGLVTDARFEHGYFSSNRNRTDDIFHFTADPVQFSQCDSMVKNNYCYSFYDERYNEIDTFPVIYEWNFGDGIKKTGKKVRHCFPGPGKYEVKLLIMDSLRTDSIWGRSTYTFELEEVEQVYIQSPDAAIVDKEIAFDGLRTNLPGFEISGYLWDFGKGFKTGPPIAYKKFDKTGFYTIKLGLLGKKDSLGNITKHCAYKKINVFEDYQEMAMETGTAIGDLEDHTANETEKDTGLQQKEPVNETSDDVVKHNTDSLAVRIYLLDDLSEQQKLMLFKNLYAFRDRTIVMPDTEQEVVSQQILTYIVKVLQENPNLKLEIAVHSNEHILPGKNREQTEVWAKNLHAFFTRKGMTSQLSNCKGYGRSRIHAGNGGHEGTGLNNRVEFIFMNKQDM